MSKEEVVAILNGTIAFFQRIEILPVETERLADILQDFASNEMYVSKADIVAWLEGIE